MYEFNAKSLQQAVNMAVANKKPRLQRKSSTSIDAGAGGNYNNGTISVSVELGQTYEISWSAEDPAGGGAIYAIVIESYDGHGSYEDTFTDSGSATFEAMTTGTIEFAVRVSYSSGATFFSYPVNISIN